MSDSEKEVTTVVYLTCDSASDADKQEAMAKNCANGIHTYKPGECLCMRCGAHSAYLCPMVWMQNYLQENE